MIKNYLLFAACVIATIGCTISSNPVTEEIRRERVIERSSWDLNCEKQNIKVTKINDTSYGASGCGKRAVYIMDQCLSRNLASICKAVLNSELTKE